MDLERIRHIRHRPPALDGADGARPVPKGASLTGKTVTPEILALAKGMDEVWLADVNEANFAGIIDAIDPKILNICGLRVADLSPLARLSRLEGLVVEWDTKVTDIAPLAHLTGLKLLALSDLPKVTDIAPLAALTGLEGLELSGGIWNVFRPATLAPLSALTNLTEIRLANIRVGDQSLAPLAGIETLRRLHISNQFPTEEYARLSVALPEAECDLFAPYVSITAYDVLITGKGKPFLTWEKDAKRIEGYEKKFRALQEKARAEMEGD